MAFEDNLSLTPSSHMSQISVTPVPGYLILLSPPAQLGPGNLTGGINGMKDRQTDTQKSWD